MPTRAPKYKDSENTMCTMCFFLNANRKCLFAILFIVVSATRIANSFTATSLRSKRIRPKFGASSLRASAIVPGDTVVVIGGTGGVGQLVVGKLQNRNFAVRTTSRDKMKGEETIANDAVDVFEVDLLSDNISALRSVLEGASAVVISVGTTAFPTGKWKGGNTPKAIDEDAVQRIADVAGNVDTMKKLVLVTSVGVERTNEMPFLILNLFGVLDAKKSGEEAVAASAAKNGFDYVIVRPGRLVGGPFTNLDIAGLLKIEGGAENGVSIVAGDSLLGDCKRDGCAEAVVQALTNDDCKNVAFSIVSNEQSALNEQQWTDAFRCLEQ